MRSLERMKGRASHANFIGIPRQVADSQAFIALPAIARALYVDLRRQHNGHNNGDISAADGVLAPYGWPHSTIHKMLKILVLHGLIEVTRHGGIASMSKITTLYAFTDSPTVRNMDKGIRGAPASWAYKTFVPAKRLKRIRRKEKVHTVNANVQGVDLPRCTE